MSDPLFSKWSDLCDRCSSDGYDSLSKPEKTWLNIRSLIDSVENGGVISYFCESGADNLTDCLEDLSELEADSVRVQIEKIAKLFPGGFPAETEARNAIIDSWPDGKVDSLLEEVDDDLMPLMPFLEKKLNTHLLHSGLTAT